MPSLIMTNEMYNEIPSLLEEGMTKEQIALQFGVKVSSLIVRCSQRGISLRRGSRRYPKRISIRPKDSVLKSYREVARSLGITERRLMTKILETIAKDNLYKAILD